MSPVKEILKAGTARLVSRDQLTQDDLGKMYRLLYDHFDGVTIEQFRRDIAEKNWVILMERSERLVGFSTLLAYETCIDGQPASFTRATRSSRWRPGSHRRLLVLGSNQSQDCANFTRAVLTSGS